MALGDFIWDKEHRTEIALLGDDGTLHLMKRTKHKAQRARAKEQNARGENGDAWAVVQSLPAQGTPPLEDVQSAMVGHQSPYGLVRAKVSSLPADDLVVLDGASRQLRIVTGDVEEWKKAQPTARVPASQHPWLSALLPVESAAIAVLPMRLNSDAISDLVILRRGSSGAAVVTTAALMTFTVTNTGDNGGLNPAPGANTGTLRQAIIDANNNPGADRIVFDIQPPGPHTITILPSITLPVLGLIDPATIDGTTQPGFAGKPIIELDGTNVTQTFGTLCLFSGSGGSTVRGLVINHTRQLRTAIQLDSDDDIIEGNFIGTDLNGTAASSNGVGVKSIISSSNSTIGGTTPAARNVISGNSDAGILVDFIVSNNCLLEGNFIGVDVTGTQRLSNGTGVDLNSSGGGSVGNWTIGGTTAGARNIISGNRHDGVDLVECFGNLVHNNFIGTDVNGTLPISNESGVLAGGVGGTIGGTANNAPNLISGNVLFGLSLSGISGRTELVQGNL